MAVFLGFISDSASAGSGGQGLSGQRFPRFVHVLGVQLDANKPPVQALANQAHCAAAEERIEHIVAGLGGGEDTRFHEVLREGSDMIAIRGAGIDAPDGAPVPSAAVFGLFEDGIRVVGVFLLLR